MAPEKDKPTTEITLCVYQDGRMALRIDDGDKIPVKDLDTAIAGIRRYAESETEEAGTRPGTEEMPAEEGAEGAAAQQEEAGFQAGYQPPGA